MSSDVSWKQKLKWNLLFIFIQLCLLYDMVMCLMTNGVSFFQNDTSTNCSTSKENRFLHYSSKWVQVTLSPQFVSCFIATAYLFYGMKIVMLKQLYSRTMRMENSNRIHSSRGVVMLSLLVILLFAASLGKHAA